MTIKRLVLPKYSIFIMMMKPLITQVQSLCTASSATIHTSKQIKAKSFTYAQDASKPKSFEKHFFIEQQQLLLSEKKMTRHISHP